MFVTADQWTVLEDVQSAPILQCLAQVLVLHRELYVILLCLILLDPHDLVYRLTDIELLYVHLELVRLDLTVIQDALDDEGHQLDLRVLHLDALYHLLHADLDLRVRDVDTLLQLHQHALLPDVFGGDRIQGVSKLV